MANLLSFLRLGRRSVLCDLADYRGGLDYDGHNTQYRNDITGPCFVVVPGECGVRIFSVMYLSAITDNAQQTKCEQKTQQSQGDIPSHAVLW